MTKILFLTTNNVLLLVVFPSLQSSDIKTNVVFAADHGRFGCGTNISHCREENWIHRLLSPPGCYQTSDM